MQSGKQTVGMALALLLLAPVAHGENMKNLITGAIINGKSSGYLDDDLVQKFSSQTKSTAPVQINFERLQKYSDKCAELAVMASQANATDSAGKNGIFNMMFKLPICIDGSYPEALKLQDSERKEDEMNKCRQAVQKGRAKDSFIEGSINFSNCPKNGAVRIFYDGACKDMHPGPDAVVKEFKIDETGTLSIKMLIPQSCLNTKSVVNKWRVFLYERRLPTFPKELIGDRAVFW